MRLNRSMILTGLTVLGLAALLSGCLKRKESIEVQRDGDVKFRIELEGDSGDYDSGDALPAEATGWRVHDETETDKDGKETKKRTATFSVAHGKPLPETFAADGDPAEATALRFPTEVTTEKRRDGSYYHFKRDYKAREQARYEYHVKKAQGENENPLAGKDPAEMTDDDRRTLVTQLRDVEAMKRSEFLAAAVTAMKDEWPQDRGLLLRRALLDFYVNFELDPVVALLGEPESPDRDQAINELGKQLTAGAREVFERELDHLKTPRSQSEKFFAAFDEEEARRTVTEDIQDETWEVRLRLPGEIVAHNGDKLDDGEIVWEFDGKALLDREQTLLATSRVGPPGKAADDE